MTLEQYLKLQQEQMENVLVVHTELRINAENHVLEPVSSLSEECHPASTDELAWLKKVWTQQYDQHQQNESFAADRLRDIRKRQTQEPYFQEQMAMTADRNGYIYAKFKNGESLRNLSNEYRIAMNTIRKIVRDIERRIN